MTLTREEARDLLFGRVLPFVDGEFANAATRLPGTVRGIDRVVAEFGDIDQIAKDSLLSSMLSRRTGQSALSAEMGVVVDAGLAVYLAAIDSPEVSGASIRDRATAMDALRESLVAEEEYVASLGDVAAADPAEADGIALRRLAVDSDGQPLQGGRRETVTFEVTQTSLTGAGQRQVVGLLYGEEGPQDDLDRAGGTARGQDIELTANNEINRGAINNPNFALSGAPANSTVIPLNQTVLPAPWVQTENSGPTVVVRTTNLWGTNATGIACSGQNTWRQFTQPLIAPVRGNNNPAFTPSDFQVVVYYDGTWEGNVTVTWGSQSQVFAHTLFTGGAGFYYLRPTKDKDLYPANYTTPSPTFAVRIETTSASGELVLHFADMHAMIERQSHWYSLWHLNTDPAEGLKKTWADTRTWAGALARAVALAYDQAPWAYLPTDSSAYSSPTLLEPDDALPLLTATHDGSALATGGTINLGTVGVSPQTVTLIFTNTGAYPAALGPHAEGTASNASLSDGDLDAASLPLDADTDESLSVDFEITPGGAGGFSCEVDVPYGGAADFTFTVEGTAA